MDVKFLTVPFYEVRKAVQQHLATLTERIDSFLEEHILVSIHYRILIGGEIAGFASIHQEKLITQFSLKQAYKSYGQAVFGKLRKQEQVQSALVPTCGEFFLAHALDEYRQIAKQAYFFSLGYQPQDNPGERLFTLRQTKHTDSAFIEEHAGKFFTPIEQYIEAKELFMVQSKEECRGFGLLKVSSLYQHVGSIGMYTIERFRRTGVASATIGLLIEECQRRGLRPVAGCWYHNHASKKTLERAGMYTQARLLKIKY
jgi:predicted acetyltransferase